MDKLVYSVPEVGELLGVSRATAYQIVRRADFPSVKVSEGRWIVPKAALERWLMSQALGE